MNISQFKDRRNAESSIVGVGPYVVLSSLPFLKKAQKKICEREKNSSRQTELIRGLEGFLQVDQHD